MTIQDGRITTAQILIVDDDQDIREALAQGISLRDINLSIITAPNGETGLQLAKQYLPDLIILDYNMPQGDGFALATQIRSEPTLKHAKLLMLTAQHNGGMAWESVEQEIDAFIAKPFDLAEVEAHIYSLLLKSTEKRRKI